MREILVEIYVPSIDCSFDVSIPRKISIAELLALVTTTVGKLSDDRFISIDPILCNASTGLIYENNMTADDVQLKNGARLILI